MSDITPFHPPLDPAELVSILQLFRSENVGPMTFYALVRRYGSAAKAIEMVPKLASQGGRKKPIVLAARAQAEAELAKLKAFGARMIVYGEADYPELLTTVTDAPPVLTVMGNPSLWKEQTLVAIVGARNASTNGCNFAKKLARELGEAGYILVSGLARGIDSFAHRGALATGTIGVIAGGIDNIYPPENETLYKEMRERGAVVTEHPFGMAPHARSFPSRNRIIAGMSKGVAVIEASTHSGSLITARFANEQGREIMAVPGSPMDPRCHGTNMLLREGATLIESTADIIDALKQFTPHAPRNLPGLWEKAEAEIPAQPGGNEEALLLAALGASPTGVEEVIAQTGLPAPLALTILLDMELAGTLQRHPGGKVSLAFRDEVGKGAV